MRARFFAAHPKTESDFSRPAPAPGRQTSWRQPASRPPKSPTRFALRATRGTAWVRRTCPRARAVEASRSLSDDVQEEKIKGSEYHHRNCRQAGDVSDPPDAICQRLLLARNPVLHNLGHGFHLCAALYGEAGRNTISDVIIFNGTKTCNSAVSCGQLNQRPLRSTLPSHTISDKRRPNLLSCA